MSDQAFARANPLPDFLRDTLSSQRPYVTGIILGVMAHQRRLAVPASVHLRHYGLQVGRWLNRASTERVMRLYVATGTDKFYARRTRSRSPETRACPSKASILCLLDALITVVHIAVQGKNWRAFDFNSHLDRIASSRPAGPAHNNRNVMTANVINENPGFQRHTVLRGVIRGMLA